MTTHSLENRWIWITGASTGLGRALVSELLSGNNKIIITSRNSHDLEKIKALNPEQIFVLAADISEPSSKEAMSASLSEITDHIDTVILNAGNCEYLNVEDMDFDLVERVTQVNYLGFVRCVDACFSLLRNSNKRPHLIGISSASTFFPLPRAEAYGASKAALTYFLQSLRIDLLERNVDVSIVYPGFIDTPLTQKNDFPMPGIISTEQACREVIKGIEKRKLEISFPRKLVWPLKVLSWLPVWLSIRLAQGMVRGNGA